MPLLFLRRRGQAVAVGGASAWQPSVSSKLTLSTGAVVQILCRRGTPAFLTQATEAKRPTYDDTVLPGLSVIRAESDQHLTGALGSAQIRTIMVAFAPSAQLDSERVLVTRATSQGGTTKAAFEIFTRRA